MTDRDHPSRNPRAATPEPAPGGCCGSTQPTTTPGGQPEADHSTHMALFRLEGLTCAHCAATVTAAVQRLPGVDRAHIDLVPGGVSTLTVAGVAPDTDDVAAAVTQAGDYRLLP